LPKELQVTLMMACMEDAPETRKSNDAALIRSREWREQKEALAREKGLDDAEDEFIESLIYHKMGHSDAYWATAGEVTAGLRRIKTKGAKIDALKDNIRIRWKGFGWKECETRWTVRSKALTIQELANRLKQLIRMQKKSKWDIPDKPAAMVPQRKSIVFLGTATKQVRRLDEKAKEGESALEERSRRNWKGREEGGFGSVHSNMQTPYPPEPKTLVGERLSVLVSVDLNDADNTKDCIWMSGVVLRVSDGTWPLTVTSRTRCYPVGEAAEIAWDAVPKIEFEASSSIHPLNPNMWNKDKVGAWCKDFGDIDYGIIDK